ncbi:MAG: preprotein translocase subunit SecE [Actinomycetota bacterium]|nr:preprotein translocase subunit SecE [Actinomycetota bacterium]
MNRQTKRTLQGQDRSGDAAAFTADSPPVTPASPAGHTSSRVEPEGASLGGRVAEYFREVRAELAKVLWPKRAEVVNYSTVVLTTLVLIALLIFGLNYVFAKGVLHLYP